MSEIEKRIESLERINRRWRHMTGLFAVLLLISLTVGAKLPDSIPEVLKAKRIEVLAPDGETYTTTGTGEAMIFLII